ncbi:flagellar motor protein MotB [Marinobacteraceae bacterium S3BR75-40.1]
MRTILQPGRRKKGGDQPSWLMTFADLMTLLLTFFILLLSFSKIDADRYKLMVQSMYQAFGGKTMEDRLVGGSPITLVESEKVPAPRPSEEAEPEAVPAKPQQPQPSEPTLVTEPQAAQSEVNPDIEKMAAELIDRFSQEVANDEMSVAYDERKVVVRFSEDASFPSGSANLKANMKPLLDEMVDILARCDGDIVVAGHTDDRPIVSSRFRSNWDLSAARAVSVVHQLVLNRKIDAERVSAAGHAETRPLVPNDSPENRARNRRVEILMYEPECRGQPSPSSGSPRSGAAASP